MSVDLTNRASAAVLMSVAVRAITEAREAWRRVRARVKANAGDDDANADADAADLRAAFRACTLAARAATSAALANKLDPKRHARMIAEAKSLNAAAADLRARLAKEVAMDAAFD